MTTCTFTELADSICEFMVPEWLFDYVKEHRNEMAAELRETGVYHVPMPTGETLIIRVKK